MRTPSDLPPSARSSRLGDRGRVALIVVAVIVVALLLSARFLSGFYIDYLWHSSVGRGDVFWGVLLSKLTLFAMFGGAFIAIAVLNLVIADRLAPMAFPANMHPVVERFHDLFGRRMRLMRIAVAAFFGLLFALPATGQWATWTLFRNSKSFGISDPQFGNDIGFYVFRLPFMTFALDWLFAALVFITLLVLLTHVLNGGVMLQPPKPKVRRATKAHIAVLLALLAVVKAGDYWVTRYELTTERRGFVQGATYSVVNAQLPAVVLLALIALLVAVLFLSTLKTDSWRLPVVASGLWAVVALLGGVIYPAAVQALVVNPNQRDREAVYIERNITATRQALDIVDIAEPTIEFGTLTAGEIADDLGPLENVRLLNPGQLVERFRNDEGLRAGLTIRDLDIDRYDLDGRQQQVVVAARELDLGTIANKSWQGRHLISTHGCGLVMAPANRVRDNGLPDYRPVDLEQPELYFSEGLVGYSIVGTTVSQETCPGQDASTTYTGDGGIALNSVFKRMAFALDFLDYNLLGSSAVTDDSRIFWIRNVRERVEKVAPFITFDADPYPVVVDGGVSWVVDGYTTSARYPYAQNAAIGQLSAGSGLNYDFNYVRNSVKAVVNAYDGSMQFYISDPDDPIVNAWAEAFPDLFAPLSAMPATLKDHLRYPEDLFRIQTEAYSKYRLDGDSFFDRKDAWSVAQGPSQVPRVQATATDATADSAAVTPVADFAEESGTARFIPYYSMFRAPDQETATFQILRPFVLFSTDDTRKELSAFMVASSDPETYGQLTAYVVRPTDTDGPATVQAAIDADPVISAQVTLLDTAGSSVVFGDMQMVPIGDDGLLYLRPLYLKDDATRQARFQFVVAVYNGNAVYGTSLRDALGKLFPTFRTDIGDIVGDTPEVEPGTDPEAPSDETVDELLQQAQDLFEQADAALPDFARYDELNRQARDLIAQALQLAESGG